jgi:hypothetical protein
LLTRKGLQALLAATGAVATAFGALGVTKGTSGVLAGGPVSPNVDSEMRFFASWYTTSGVLLLKAARRPERETDIVRAAAGGFLLAAGGRMLSRRSHGPPSRMFTVLTAIEFVLPVVLVSWQQSIRNAAAQVS